MFCKKCGKEIPNDANICSYCGEKINDAVSVANGDSSSFGIGILSFFFPIVGLILWLVNKDTKPLYAKSAGLGGLIGFITSIVGWVLYFIFYIVLIILMGGMYY